ncbi:MAG: dephospho-CoA kinase [Lachnospira sp.]
MSRLKKIYGITGGVGVGKSTVINMIKENFDALVIMADDVAKELMLCGNEGFKKTVEIFGDSVILENGQLDRKKIAEIIFSQPEKRIELNKAIHPLVKKYIFKEIDIHKKADDYKYIFVEAALLLEDNYDEFLDEIWLVTAPLEIRRQRLKVSRGYSDEKIDNMVKSQMSEEELKKTCTVIIDNGGTQDETLQQLEKLLE